MRKITFTNITHLICKLDTGPSCKELRIFENTIVSHLIYMCPDWFSSPKGKNMIRPIPDLRVQWSIFSPQNKLLWKPGTSFPGFTAWSRYRHLEFLIHLLIGWNLWRPSWIWKTIESIVLETIAYCLSRLLIGYRSYEPGIVVGWRDKVTVLLFSDERNQSSTRMRYIVIVSL